MAKLSDIMRQEKNALLDFDGEKVAVTYRPNAMTPLMEQRLQDAAADDDLAALGELFCMLVVSWDLEDDDGNTVPIHPDDVVTVGSTILNAIIAEVQESGRPNRRKRGTSGAGTR